MDRRVNQTIIIESLHKKPTEAGESIYESASIENMNKALNAIIDRGNYNGHLTEKCYKDFNKVLVDMRVGQKIIFKFGDGSTNEWIKTDSQKFTSSKGTVVSTRSFAKTGLMGGTKSMEIVDVSDEVSEDADYLYTDTKRDEKKVYKSFLKDVKSFAQVMKHAPLKVAVDAGYTVGQSGVYLYVYGFKDIEPDEFEFDRLYGKKYMEKYVKGFLTSFKKLKHYDSLRAVDYWTAKTQLGKKTIELGPYVEVYYKKEDIDDEAIEEGFKVGKTYKADDGWKFRVNAKEKNGTINITDIESGTSFDAEVSDLELVSPIMLNEDVEVNEAGVIYSDENLAQNAKIKSFFFGDSKRASLFDEFIESWQKASDEYYKKNLPNLELNILGCIVGKSYIKVTQNKGGSVVAFVDAYGNVYKPASWNAPAKGVRYYIDDKTIKFDSVGSFLYGNKNLTPKTDADWE